MSSFEPWLYVYYVIMANVVISSNGVVVVREGSNEPENEKNVSSEPGFIKLVHLATE